MPIQTMGIALCSAWMSSGESRARPHRTKANSAEEEAALPEWRYEHCEWARWFATA